MNQITENTLYTNDTEKAALIADKEKVASAFFINFLGTLGLFSISSTRGIMKTYFADDGKLQLVNIGDANKDTSLATKLYSDIGGLKPDTANKITRLLFKLKSRTITSKNFDEVVVRELVKEIQFIAHRPHPAILNVVKQFESGTASLKQVSKAFFLLIKSRKKDFEAISREFYGIARQYQLYLKDIPDIGSVVTAAISTTTAQNAVPHAAGLGGATTGVSKVVNQKPKATTIQTVAKPAPISDTDFYLLLWKATSNKEITKLLKERGIDQVSSSLLQDVMGYLMPHSNAGTASDTTTMVLSLMPALPDFDKGFGGIIKNTQWNVNYQACLLNKCAESSTFEDLEKNMAFSRMQLRKLFQMYGSFSINGKTTGALKSKIINKYRDHFQSKIAAAQGSDDVGVMITEASQKIIAVAKDYFKDNYGYTNDNRIIGFVDSPLSSEERVKILIAYIVAKMAGFGDAITLLIKELKFSNIAFTSISTDPYDPKYNIPVYDKLFPNSKQIIDAWTKDGSMAKLTFGEFDTYANILKGLGQVHLRDSLNTYDGFIPADITPGEIAKNLLAKMDIQNYTDEMYYRMFNALGGNVGKTSTGWSGTNNRALKVVRLIHLELAKMYTDDVKSGKFEIDKIPDTNRFVDSFYSAIRDEFKKPGEYEQENWDANTALVKAIFEKDEKLRISLMDKCISYGSDFNKVLLAVSWSLEQGIRYILDKTRMSGGFNSFEIGVLSSAAAGPYLKPQDYENLARMMNIASFVTICKNHNVDAFKHVPYDLILKHVKDTLADRYGDITRSEMITVIFNKLTDKDKEAVLGDVKDKLFSNRNMYYRHSAVTRAYNTGKAKIIEHLAGTDYLKKIIEEAPVEDRFGLFSLNTKEFFRLSSIDRINEQLHALPQNVGVTSDIDKDELLAAVLSRKDILDVESVKNVVGSLANYNKNSKPAVRRAHEHRYYKAIEMLSAFNKDAADQLFRQMPLVERRQLVGYLVEERFLEDSLADVQGDNVLIKPLISVTEQRLVQILKYNDIQTPRRPIVKDNVDLSTVMGQNLKVPPVKDLHVTLDDLDTEKLERLSVEYDAFNKYAHGELALRIVKSFDVNVPIQEEGYKKWIDKMNNEGTDPNIMKPIFHGTGSIGACMILRYGFKVIKANDASVVGRMLGDGIYFSNVLDKVAQYVGDEGFSRRFGTQGFIFEMEGSLGKHRRDYRCAGTGKREDERNTVSPEWAVFNPNEQLRIYKAYHVELISKSAMTALKAKHLTPNESTAVQIKGFKQFINEGSADMTHCITYIFMDGDIPVSEQQAVDFKEFTAAKFGKDVKLDWTGSGPSVMIYNSKESKTYVVRYTHEFMENRHGEFDEYLKLMKIKK